MYHVVHLLLFFCFAGTKKTSLLNFVSERIIFLKLVYRINNIRYSFKKNKLPFKLVKTTFYGPHTFKLKSISKYRFLLHWKSFENIWSFILYLKAGETQLINTCVVPFAIAESVTNVTKKLWKIKIAVSKCPCSTFTNALFK